MNKKITALIDCIVNSAEEEGMSVCDHCPVLAECEKKYGTNTDCEECYAMLEEWMEEDG